MGSCFVCHPSLRIGIALLKSAAIGTVFVVLHAHDEDHCQNDSTCCTKGNALIDLVVENAMNAPTTETKIRASSRQSTRNDFFDI